MMDHMPVKTDEKVMEINEEELARIKKMIYAGKADICWFLHRKEVKGLIKIAEDHFKLLEQSNGHNSEIS